MLSDSGRIPFQSLGEIRMKVVNRSKLNRSQTTVVIKEADWRDGGGGEHNAKKAFSDHFTC